MEFEFTKMHGLGNDFVVIDAVRQNISLTTEQIRAIADRRCGIGCDQVLLVEMARAPDTQFHYRIFNADGGEVEQCGNGARCFARFVRDQGLTDTDQIDVGTATGAIRLFIESDQRVRVNMGPPVLQPREIPFEASRQANSYAFEVDGVTLEIGALSMGNPHAILLVDDVDRAPVATLGPLIEAHPRFPQRVNAGFLEIVSRTRVNLRVFERGVGETLACGTGACAAIVYGRLLDRLDEQVEVHLPGGALVVSWRKEYEPVWMTGPAESVFEGKITL
jgi:diaminopimelate epimerase